VFEKTVAEMETQLGKTTWLASDMYTLADAEITPYIERVDRLGLAGLWESRPRVADWFARIKARPSYKESRITHRLTTTTPVVMGSKIGHGKTADRGIIITAPN
jgi:glutathione S-transferase